MGLVFCLCCAVVVVVCVVVGFDSIAWGLLG